jgi:hypothetical protein
MKDGDCLNLFVPIVNADIPLLSYRKISMSSLPSPSLHILNHSKVNSVPDQFRLQLLVYLSVELLPQIPPSLLPGGGPPRTADSLETIRRVVLPLRCLVKSCR